MYLSVCTTIYLPCNLWVIKYSTFRWLRSHLLLFVIHNVWNILSYLRHLASCGLATFRSQKCFIQQVLGPVVQRAHNGIQPWCDWLTSQHYAHSAARCYCSSLFSGSESTATVAEKRCLGIEGIVLVISFIQNTSTTTGTTIVSIHTNN